MGRENGFTLLELMITVAIVAVLAAIAVPIYTHYVYRSKQVEAKSLLMSVRAEQEEFRAENNSYTNVLANLVESKQMSASAQFYTLAIPVGNTTAFRAQVTGILAKGHPQDIWFIRNTDMYATHTGAEAVY